MDPNYIIMAPVYLFVLSQQESVQIYKGKASRLFLWFDQDLEQENWSPYYYILSMKLWAVFNIASLP